MQSKYNCSMPLLTETSCDAVSWHFGNKVFKGKDTLISQPVRCQMATRSTIAAWIFICLFDKALMKQNVQSVFGF